MTEILWGFMQKIDKDCEYVYNKGQNGLMRWLINYLDRTHEGWNDPPPKFTPLEPRAEGIREVQGEWSLPAASSAVDAPQLE